MNLAALGGWPAVLGPLTNGRDLTAEETTAAVTDILEGAATPAQVAAFAVGLRMKGETVEEMAALLDVMLAFGQRVELPETTDAVDTCGTGGDRACTINASTVAALVVAGAGAKVCKHGNRSQTSECGSADLLEALGVVIDLDPTGVAACVERAGMGFCFAPQYHPAFRHVGPVRRELGVPTVFNFLGPVANPARVRRQVLGVSDPAMAAKLVGVLQAHGSERALVVYGHDGLDELSTITTSTVVELREGHVRSYDVDPVKLGLKQAALEDIQGGTPAVNADLARRVLDGEPGPRRDFILLNAAAGLVAAGVADDLAEGLEAAAASVDSGGAAAVLERLVAVSVGARLG
ncbi:MAG TPA: anthranilate phosphoribosyltransferase [Acidimicrobiales bacterium]|nr:anthranilate phosphoribosyltransferase [Acidimicrobiales bacterium]